MHALDQFLMIITFKLESKIGDECSHGTNWVADRLGEQNLLIKSLETRPTLRIVIAADCGLLELVTLDHESC
jgi:hypothetical protein